VRTLVVFLVFTWATEAWCQEPGPACRRKVDEGMAAYKARDFARAARLLGEAYALEPRRDVLFAQAQATRLTGDCAAALPLYQQFLDSDPPEQQIAATRIAMSRCEATPPRPAVVVAVAPPPPPPAPPPFHRDLPGGLLVGGGLLAGGLGAALMASAHAQNGAAVVQDRYPDYAQRRASAEHRWGLGLGLAIAGAALVLGGAGRYLWVGSQGSGLGGSLGGRF
jgi:hypothetical protein